MNEFIPVRIIDFDEHQKRIILNLNQVCNISLGKPNMLSIKMSNKDVHSVYIDDNEILKSFEIEILKLV